MRFKVLREQLFEIEAPVKRRVSLYEPAGSMAIFGGGYWGEKCIATVSRIAPQIILHVVEPNKGIWPDLKNRFPQIWLHQDPSFLETNPGVSMALVAVPPRLHGSLTTMLLDRGIHVLLEKPFHLSQDEMAQARKFVSRGIKLSAGYLYLHHRSVQAVKEAIETGRYGRLLFVDSTRHSFGAFRRDVGVVRDLAVHDISIAQFLFGLEIPAVTGLVQRFPLSTGFFGEVECELIFSGGGRFRLSASQMRPERIRRIVFFFERTVLVFDESDSEKPLRAYKPAFELMEHQTEVPNDEYPKLTFVSPVEDFSKFSKPLDLSIISFIEAVNNDGEIAVGIEIASAVNSTVEAIEAAAENSLGST